MSRLRGPRVVEAPKGPRPGDPQHPCTGIRTGALVWEDGVDSLFCRPACERDGKPCDLCLAQRRKARTDRDLAEGRPTLRWSPFRKLGGGTP